VVRLLAEPVRWQLMRALAGGDQRVRELVAALGQRQNLISYHLRQLRDGGLGDRAAQQRPHPPHLRPHHG
jgi:ArsR family transcriptional regulator, arsenate/arsenite/antimonite-responsive transcriptional repressor / arsenate reductase (thioredoxin)